jgi:hypothetical protein
LTLGLEIVNQLATFPEITLNSVRAVDRGAEKNALLGRRRNRSAAEFAPIVCTIPIGTMHECYTIAGCCYRSHSLPSNTDFVVKLALGVSFFDNTPASSSDESCELARLPSSAICPSAVVELLLEAGADPNSTPRGEETAPIPAERLRRIGLRGQFRGCQKTDFGDRSDYGMRFAPATTVPCPIHKEICHGRRENVGKIL